VALCVVGEDTGTGGVNQQGPVTSLGLAFLRTVNDRLDGVQIIGVGGVHDDIVRLGSFAQFLEILQGTQ